MMLLKLVVLLMLVMLLLVLLPLLLLLPLQVFVPDAAWLALAITFAPHSLAWARGQQALRSLRSLRAWGLPGIYTIKDMESRP